MFNRKYTKINLKYAWFALAILSSLNLLNYADRNVFNALMQPIKINFGFTDFQLGLLASAFLFVYAIAAYPLARIADRGLRKWVLVTGVFIWSFSTFLTGTASSFSQLFIYRSVLGIGEASYATTLAPLLSDYFPLSLRSTALGIANAPLGIGTGLGYYIAGISHHVFGGWRKAFYIVGVPGVILGFITLFLREPVMGLGDQTSKQENNAQEKDLQWQNDPGQIKLKETGALENQNDIEVISQQNIFVKLGILFQTKTLLWLFVSSIFLTFSLGGMLVWLTPFLQRYFGFSNSSAAIDAATAAGIGSLIGVFLGGISADWWSKVSENAPIWVVIIGFFLSAFFAYGAVISKTKHEVLWCIGGGAFFQMATNGPILAAMMNVTPPNLRATCNAIYLFLIHFLGDAFSPTVIGYISTHYHDLRLALYFMPFLTFISALLAGGALLTYAKEKHKILKII